MTGSLTERRPLPLRCVFLFAVALGGLGLPLPAGAQPVPPATEPGEGRPLEVLLEHRESLALTSDQVNRLDGVRDRLSRANEPLVNRMMALRKEWQEEGGGDRRSASDRAARRKEIRATAESLRSQIQENNRMAMRAVNRLLTRDQRARLRTLVEDRQRQDRPAGRRGARAGVSN